jgi:hypothetical protein
VRRSWGTEGQWKLTDQMPSPTKGTSENRWLEEEERFPPESPKLLPIIPAETVSLTPTSVPQATSSQIEEMKSQYTQELVDLVGGDTEEDTDAEEPSPPDGIPIEQEEPTLKRSQFAVFRDDPILPLEIPQNTDDTEVHLSEYLHFDLEQNALLNFSPHDESAGGEMSSHQTEGLGQETLNFPPSQLELPSSSEEAKSRHLSNATSIEAQSAISQMLPPTLPTIQTSNFGFGFGQPSSLGPQSALPTSPITPDIRPQRSSTLPLPSPFPGDDLATSYIDVFPSPQLPGDLFGSSQTTSPTVPPDHLFQFGFGFGSGGLVQEGLSFMPDLNATNLPNMIHASSPQTESLPVLTEGDALVAQLDMPTPSTFELNHPGEISKRVSDDIAKPTLIQEKETLVLYPDLSARLPGEETFEVPASDERAPSSVHEQSRSPKTSSQMVIDLTLESSEASSSNSEDDEQVVDDNDQTMQDYIQERHQNVEATDASNIVQSADESLQSDEDEDEDDDDDEDDMGSDAEESDVYVSGNANSTLRSESTLNTQPSLVASHGVPQYDGTFDASSGLYTTLPAAFVSSSSKFVASTGIHRETVVIDLGSEGESVAENEDVDAPIAAREGAITEPKLQTISVIDVPNADDDDDEQVEKEIEVPVTQRPAETFAPRITRARTATHPDLSTIADTQSLSETVVQSHSTSHIQQSLEVSNLPVTPDLSSNTFSQSTLLADQGQSALPPTPQLTDGTSYPSLRSAAHEERTEKTVHEMAKIEENATHVQKSSRHRPAQTSDFPNVLSPWFSSNCRASGSLSPLKEKDTQESQPSQTDSSFPAGASVKNETGNRHPYADSGLLSSHADQSKLSHSQAELPTSPQPISKSRRGAKGGTAKDGEVRDSQLPTQYSFSQSQQTQSKGLLTRFSYYTPVVRLVAHINISSSQAYNDAGLDLLAVVSKPTTVPQRAEKGQRDYYTTFSITDASFWPCNVRVQVFRPWKGALPKASKGDVVLLRGFEVFSAKGPIGFALRSGEEGAWCVWRWSSDLPPASDDLDSRVLDSGAEKTLREREEIRGPPVEVGDEERVYVDQLKGWWGEQPEGSSMSNVHGSLKIEESGVKVVE